MPATDALDHRIPERLPLLDAFMDERLPRDYRLDAATLVMIQHQLGSIVPLTMALIALGADPRRLHWVDIPYTANRAVVARLVALGIPEENFAPSDYDLEKRYAAYQHQRVTHLIASLRRSMGEGERLLVLDDGAYFAEAASCFADRLPAVALVEQTRRGMMKIRAGASSRAYVQSTRFVNVAESSPKLELEPRGIAESIARALCAALERHQDAISDGPALLLGYGVIGRVVAGVLRDSVGIPSSAIHVHDPLPDAQASARDDGFASWPRTGPDTPRYRLVLGCSGTTSFTVEDRVFLEDGAILASASSGAAELSREEFIELADAHDEDDIHIYDRETLRSRPVHSDIRLRLVDRDATFLNGGFPVNFSGDVNCVPWPHIALTRVLMLAGAVQALAAPDVGIQPLAPDTCDWLTRRFLTLTEA